jgi:hypothetical protein
MSRLTRSHEIAKLNRVSDFSDDKTDYDGTCQNIARSDPPENPFEREFGTFVIKRSARLSHRQSMSNNGPLYSVNFRSKKSYGYLVTNVSFPRILKSY